MTDAELKQLRDRLEIEDMRPQVIGCLGLSCWSCVYFEGIDAGSSSCAYGWCHRNPPIRDAGGTGQWPEVRPDSFCGEYQSVKEMAELFVDQLAEATS